MRERLYQYYLLMRLDRPIGILLLLWPTLWALWMAAGGLPDLQVLLVFVAGVVLMRSAGCVINDFADRRIDPHVRRTRERPIAAGRVSPREALLLFAVLCLAAFALVLTLNRLTVLLSFGALALAALYPFTKRYTRLPQVVLGAAFGWAIPMAFAAQTGEVPRLAWLLFTVNVLWATAYDTMYAMVDREDDLKIGVKSTAILFGEADRLVIGVLQLLVLLGLVLAGRLASLGLLYHFGLLLAAGFALYQQYLIRRRDAEGCFAAFLNNNWFGAAVFVGIVLDYLGRAG
ncbi:4-hydroxybenzoate octaprenyltransferase [Thiohalobacter sp. IOR34]|nr:4-hydroxybenzoate octaprenyltransferase [Thiohalobacter sp. IOR34]WJW76790.1 4-hydroxybenzoate octaprenyltransferase [Thiohalobacter sp. IOR34]